MAKSTPLVQGHKGSVLPPDNLRNLWPTTHP